MLTAYAKMNTFYKADAQLTRLGALSRAPLMEIINVIDCTVTKNHVISHTLTYIKVVIKCMLT